MGATVPHWPYPPLDTHVQRSHCRSSADMMESYIATGRYEIITCPLLWGIKFHLLGGKEGIIRVKSSFCWFSGFLWISWSHWPPLEMSLVRQLWTTGNLSEDCSFSFSSHNKGSLLGFLFVSKSMSNIGPFPERGWGSDHHPYLLKGPLSDEVKTKTWHEKSDFCFDSRKIHQEMSSFQHPEPPRWLGPLCLSIVFLQIATWVHI